MKRSAVILALLLVAGCHMPSGHRVPYDLPVEIEGGGIRYPGDVVKLIPRESLGTRDVELTVTNVQSGATSKKAIANKAVASTTLVVDPDHLPGLDLQAPDVQSFTLTLRIASGSGIAELSSGITVVLDREALPPVRVPLGKAPVVGMTMPGQEPVEDVEELASQVVAAWEGEALCITSRLRGLDELTLPQPLREQIPPGLPLREFVVRGDFPKRVVTAPWHSEGDRTLVMAPSALRFVIAETRPSHLVKLTALSAADLGSIDLDCTPEEQKE